MSDSHDSKENGLIPRGPRELKRWSGGLISRGLDELLTHNFVEDFPTTHGEKNARFSRSEIASAGIAPPGNTDSAIQTNPGLHASNTTADSSNPTREQMLNDPEILEIMADLGNEYYIAGVKGRSQWHASVYAHLEKLAEGLGSDLEPLFGMTWSSVTGEEDYAGGIGGIYRSREQTPKTFKPDYGLRLLRDGVSPTIDQIFYDFRLYSLSVLGLGRYSTMVEMPYAGETHALSLDFDQAQLNKILLKASQKLRTYIKSQIAADPTTPRTIDFEGEISFGVRARLGEQQKVPKEIFVPLIAQEILDFDGSPTAGFPGEKSGQDFDAISWPDEIEDEDEEIEWSCITCDHLKFENHQESRLHKKQYPHHDVIGVGSEPDIPGPDEAIARGNVYGHDPFAEVDFLYVVASKEQVESGNPNQPLTSLRRLLAHPKTAAKFCNNVDIAFHGYDLDPRELWEIPEVRRFVSKLDAEFPYWLYFLSKKHSGLQCVAFCLLPTSKIGAGMVCVSPQEISKLLISRWFPAMNQICSFAGFKQHEVDALTDRVTDYFLKGPENLDAYAPSHPMDMRSIR
jgi:hypothetical protein